MPPTAPPMIAGLWDLEVSPALDMGGVGGEELEAVIVEADKSELVGVRPAIAVVVAAEVG